jgi:aryl sulfotransferase
MSRKGDIIVATPAKTGTTWVQTILLHLIYPGDERPRLAEVSPWLDTKTEEQVRALDESSHRRFIKTHTPLDGLPYWPEVTYLVVGRDGRDAFMSAFHHLTSEEENAITIRAYWQRWITDDESSLEPQAPLVSDINGRLRYYCHFFRTFWKYRHLENIRFIHFNDLLADLPGEICHIAEMVSIDITEDFATSIAESVRFSNVKRNAASLYGADSRSQRWSKSIIHKGTNGRWKRALTDDDVKAYRTIVEETLLPECARWLENGRLSADF